MIPSSDRSNMVRMKWGTVIFLVAACGGCARSGEDVPFETYDAQSGPSSAAGLDGTLRRDGDCLYVDVDGTKVAILLPSSARWHAETDTLSVSGRDYRIGQEVTLGGQMANEDMFTRCEGADVFVVG